MKTTFTLSPRKVGILLGIIALVMSVLACTFDVLELKYDSDDKDHPHIHNLWPVARQFNFVEEGNIANCYQGLQLILASSVLFVIWRGKKQAGGAFRGHWLTLGIIFLFLGTDEIAQIHEESVAVLIAAFRDYESDKTGWFWVYLPLLAVFCLAFIPFLLRLPRQIGKLFVISGTIYVSGVLALEKLVNWFAEKYGHETIGYVLLDNLSEFMESSGIALFIYTLVLYLAITGDEIRFQLAQSPDTGRKPD